MNDKTAPDFAVMYQVALTTPDLFGEARTEVKAHEHAVHEFLRTADSLGLDIEYTYSADGEPAFSDAMSRSVAICTGTHITSGARITGRADASRFAVVFAELRSSQLVVVPLVTIVDLRAVERQPLAMPDRP